MSVQRIGEWYCPNDSSILVDKKGKDVFVAFKSHSPHIDVAQINLPYPTK